MDVGAVFPISASQLGALGIQRPRERGSFGPEEKRLAEELLPHLCRTLQLRYRLMEAGIEQQATFEALERSSTAIVVAGGDGQVIYANRGRKRCCVMAIRFVSLADGLRDQRNPTFKGSGHKCMHPPRRLPDGLVPPAECCHSNARKDCQSPLRSDLIDL